MKQLRQIPEFFIYSNLFIAACAILMVYQTTWLLLNSDPEFDYTAFVFFSTLTSYSFHYYLTYESVLPSHRITWIKQFRIVHVIFFIIGLAGVAWFGFQLLPHWPWLLLAAGATFLYSAPKIPHPLFRSLRKIAIGKTIFLAFIWMYVTTILPVIVAGQTSHAEFWIFAINRFFFIYAICILFDYRDRADDKAAGIRSLITYMGSRSIATLFVVSLLIYFLTTIWLYYYDYRILVIVILLLPGLILAFSYKYATRHFSDFYYYFVLDGLMALSALLLLLWKILIKFAE